MNLRPRYHVRKDDLVMVIAGKERGKSGKVLRILPKRDRVVVERVNLIKRHTKPSRKAPQGGIIEREAPIHVSNVLLLCERCRRPVRAGHRVVEDGRKVRVCKRCGEILDKGA